MTTGDLWIDLEAQPLYTGALYEKAAFRLLEMTSGGKARLRRHATARSSEWAQ